MVPVTFPTSTYANRPLTSGKQILPPITLVEAFTTLEEDLKNVLNILPAILDEFDKDVDRFGCMKARLREELWIERIRRFGKQEDQGRRISREISRDGTDGTVHNSRHRDSGLDNRNTEDFDGNQGHGTNNAHQTQEDPTSLLRPRITVHQLQRLFYLLEASCHLALTAKLSLPRPRPTPETLKSRVTSTSTTVPSYSISGDLKLDFDLDLDDHDDDDIGYYCNNNHYQIRTSRLQLRLEDINDFRAKANFWIERIGQRLKGEIIIGELIFRFPDQALRLVRDMEGLKDLLGRERKILVDP